MKALMIALLLTGTTAWGMTNMPEGKYQGTGQWKDTDGKTGKYTIETAIRAGVVASTYRFDGQTRDYTFEAKSTADGFFDVHVHGHKVGEGYCMSVQCHYAISFGDTAIEETLTFWQGNFYRIGSKKVDSKLMTWEESMAKAGE